VAVFQQESAPQTKSNTAGRVIVRRVLPEGGQSHDDESTPFENFEDLATKLLKVPKEEVDEKRAEREKARKRKRD
jgi:hypothetical protein